MRKSATGSECTWSRLAPQKLLRDVALSLIPFASIRFSSGLPKLLLLPFALGLFGALEASDLQKTYSQSCAFSQLQELAILEFAKLGVVKLEEATGVRQGQ